MTPFTLRGALGAFGATTALVGLPATAAAAPIHVHGAVVHRDARAHSFVVADRAGHLYAIHGRAPAIGSVVAVTANRLRNGTLHLQHAGLHGTQRHVRIRGVVTYVNRRARTFTVSARGVSMLVVPSRRHGARAAADPALPAVGNDVIATGTLDSQGELEAESVTTQGTDTNPIDLEGTVLSVDTSARTITVSADDQDASGASITVSVPASFDLTAFSQGEQVSLRVTPTGPGTATLVESADDSNAQSADSQSGAQGEDASDGGENSGSGDSGPAGGDSDSGSGSAGASGTGGSGD